MKHHSSAWFRRRIRRAQRGAALLYALIAVIVIATLTLATGRLISHHLALEQNSEGYSRAINIAEAAANWQLNRMSRSKLPSDPTGTPGRLSWEAVNTWNETTNQQEPFVGQLPSGETGGVAVSGEVTVWVRNINGEKWTAPDDFVLRTLGTDPATSITRGVEVFGTAIGVSEPYGLFAQNELYFDSVSTEYGAESGKATLAKGYIGSNARVVSNPNGQPPTAKREFFGCRLGPQTTLSPLPATWGTAWDFPRLPDVVNWPTVSQVLSAMYQGNDISTFGAPNNVNNDNAQIDAMGEDGNFQPLPLGADTRVLTSDKFSDWSPTHHTLRIRASETAAHGNLFYFEKLQMGNDDVLILDMRATYPDWTGPNHSMRIVINNSDTGPEGYIKLTNLAYFQSTLPQFTAGEINPPRQSYFWFNNTPGPLRYQPTQAAHTLPNSPSPNWHYEVEPTLRGMVFGLNSYSADGNTAGDIVVAGKQAFPVTVNALVGNHVRLLGPVTVKWNSAEDPKNPSKYVLYYSIFKRNISEINPTGVDPRNMASVPSQKGAVYDYGQ